MTDAPKGDFQFGATVDVEFAAAFDAGVLFLRIYETHWAELCFEYPLISNRWSFLSSTEAAHRTMPTHSSLTAHR